MQELQNPEHRKALEIVYGYLGQKNIFLPTEVGLLFGHWTKEHRIPHAANLFRQGLVKEILVMIAHGDGRSCWPEGAAEHHRQLLIANGVPSEAIISEPIAWNTLDECQKAIPILAASEGLSEETIRTWKWALISDQTHQLRASLCFKKWNPDTTWTVNLPASLPETLENVREAVAEVGKLALYAWKGDIAGLPRPSEEVLKAYEVLMKLV